MNTFTVISNAKRYTIQAPSRLDAAKLIWNMYHPGTDQFFTVSGTKKDDNLVRVAEDGTAEEV